MLEPTFPANLIFDERGLVPVITQDASSGEVLMFAWATREAVEITLATRQAHYFSVRAKNSGARGATSGHVQEVVEVRYDCDGDALLYRVRQTGAACHTGARSCFYRSLTDETSASMGDVMGLLERVVSDRLTTLPEGSYVTRLHERGLGYVAQKSSRKRGRASSPPWSTKTPNCWARPPTCCFTSLYC